MIHIMNHHVTCFLHTRSTRRAIGERLEKFSMSLVFLHTLILVIPGLMILPDTVSEMSNNANVSLPLSFVDGPLITAQIAIRCC